MQGGFFLSPLASSFFYREESAKGFFKKPLATPTRVDTAGERFCMALILFAILKNNRGITQRKCLFLSAFCG
jgi:hypothetical protein